MLAAFVKSISPFSPFARPRATAAPEPAEIIPPTPGADVILVPQSAMDAYPEDPDPLVDAVMGYVSTLTRFGRFTPQELPEAAHLVCQLETYRADVARGGHARYLGNARLTLDENLEAVLRGLRILTAERHLEVAQGLADWAALYPGDARHQTGTGDAVPAELQELDARFAACDAADPLRPRLAAWIARHPRLGVVPDAQMADALDEVCHSNPERARRHALAEIGMLTHQLSDPTCLSLGVAMGALPDIEPIIEIGSPVRLRIGARKPLVHLIRTTRGKRWGVTGKPGAAIFERVGAEMDELPGGDDAPRDADLAQWRPPEVGAKISHVDLERIGMARLTARKLDAAAALHLLTSHLPHPARIDWVTVREAGRDPEGQLRLTASLMLNDGQLALSAEIDPEGARLLSEPDQTELAAVPAEAVAAHAHRLTAAAA